MGYTARNYRRNEAGEANATQDSYQNKTGRHNKCLLDIGGQKEQAGTFRLDAT